VAPCTLDRIEIVWLAKYSDVEDLLVDVGKKYDRTFLHQTISKLFDVPHSVLSNAEKTSPIPPSVSNEVRERRRLAKDAKFAADNAVNGVDANGTSRPVPNNNKVVADASASPPVPPVEDKILVNREEIEYADPEHLCESCLPVHGDEVIGTRLRNPESGTTMVHRLGCPRAQRAINQAKRTVSVSNPLQSRIDSITLKLMRNSRFASKDGFQDEVPVKLEWADFNELNGNTCMYTAEVLVVAEDRKLLLADCSEIVSEQAEIVKTGSATTNEHATLVFLVKVTGLDHLQRLMDQLTRVQSVMSVERRFGSDLL